MPMKDSRMTDEWIARAVGAYPIKLAANGDIVTCPVRLAFTDNLFKPGKQTNDDGTVRETYNCVLLFPPGAEQGITNVMYRAWHAACQSKHSKNFAPDGQPFGLHWPVHDGAEKPQYTGYQAGLKYVGVASEYKPAIVDPALNPIVDPARVYSGCWAIVGLNVYAYGNKKKGAGFGLQTIMIVADDEKLGGAGADPKQTFAGVTIDASFNPAGQFGEPAGAALMPPAQVVGGGMALPPGAPPPLPPAYAAPPPPYAPPAAPRAPTMAELMGEE